MSIELSRLLMPMARCIWGVVQPCISGAVRQILNGGKTWHEWTPALECMAMF
jgi:hypothetical protein